MAAVVAAFVVLSMSACAVSQSMHGVGADMAPEAATSSGPAAHEGQIDPTASASIVDVVRAYLQDDAVHRYSEMVAMTTGPLHQHWDWTYQEMGDCRCPPEDLSITGIRVSKIDGNEATVALAASLTTEGRTTSITGPMSLGQDGEGTWRIVGYQRNGVAFPLSTALREASETTSNIEVDLLGVERVAKEEDVWFRFTNHRANDIALIGMVATSGSSTLRPVAWNDGISELPANMYFVTDIDWAAHAALGEDRPLRIHLTFVDQVSGERVHIDIATTT